MIAIYCGKRFDVEKGLFPHNLATSIKRLKNTKHLPSKDSPLWISVLTGKAPDGDKIDKARKHFVKSKSKNLYQYVESYCCQDTLALRHAVYCSRLFDWNTNKIDFVLLNKYTLASLSSFIAKYIAPMSIKHHIAPYEYSHPLINNIIENSLVGGITICGASGSFQSNKTTINPHLLIGDMPSRIDPKIWPALAKLRNRFSNSASENTPLISSPNLTNCVETYDVRNLYGTAMCHPIPVGEYTIWTPLVNNCSNIVDGNVFAKYNAQGGSNFYSEEFYAVRYYLENKIPNNEEVIVVRSLTHCAGQLSFHTKASVDLYVVSKYKSPLPSSTNYFFVLRFIQYDGTYWHANGVHKTHCLNYNGGDLHETSRESTKRHEQLENYVKRLFSLSPFPETHNILIPVSYTHLTLPTKA